MGDIGTANAGASLLQRAIALHNQGRLPDAAAAYRQLLVAEPGNPDALHLLGVALAQMGSPEEAIGLIRAAVKARPNAAMALWGRSSNTPRPWQVMSEHRY
jgi:tetratricopeptide (TPR) repeat protein